MLSKDTYIRRRNALINKLKGEKGIVLFLGNLDSPAQYFDNAYKWRQDSNWLYFYGIDEARFAATIDLESGEQTIFADDFDIDDIIWTGPMPSVQSLAESTGIDKTKPYAALKDSLKNRKVHFLSVSRYYNAIKISELLNLNPLELFRQGKNPSEKASKELTKAVIELRLIKDFEEIKLIEDACDLGYEMHTIARNAIKLGVKEQDIVGLMEGYCLSKAWGTSFSTILTQHGEIFHNHGHQALLEPGKLLVIDAGVESNEHYASDFTRTYPTSGKFSTKQRDIYNIVYQANELAYSLIAPGVPYKDIHLAVSKYILQSFKDLDIVRGDVDEMTADGLAGLFMPHGLGHNMGIDVHDMEDLGENAVGYDDDQNRSSQLGLGSLRMARCLKPGNVITDEPGIYFIPDLIRKYKSENLDKGCVNYSKLETYFDFGGIRLEDDILVTDKGAKRLGSRRLPIAPKDIEELV